MSKAALKKIRVTGLKKHYKLLMQELHRSGVIQVVENREFVEKSQKNFEDHFGVLDLAKLQFALEFLAPYAPAKSKLDSMLSGGKLALGENEAKERLKSFSAQSVEVVSECEILEERLVKAQNELTKIPVQAQVLDHLAGLSATLEADYDTAHTKTYIGKVARKDARNFANAIAGLSNELDFRPLGEDKRFKYVRVTGLTSLTEEIEAVLAEFSFEALDISADFADYYGKTPSEITKMLDQKAKQYDTEIKESQVRSAELAVHVEDLKIAYDYNDWRKTKNDLQQKIFLSEKTFAFEGWVIGSAYDDLKKWIKNAFVGEVSMETVKPHADEEMPVFMKNKWGVGSFEAVTQMYGLPQVKEFDPTPLLAPFFLVFFGLCLSDVGYGAILATIVSVFLLFGKFSTAAKSTLRLVLYCGLAAIVGGILLGGYFGITPAQMPFLVNPETGLFYGQFLTPTEGSGPITFLIISLSLGVIQLLFGMIIDFIQKIKHGDYDGAFFDTAVWIFVLVSLGLFALAGPIGLDKNIAKYLAIAGVISLIVTQGRHQKNWFLKPLFGLLGVYNITNYLSDILSYSRIMALGLATGVVGFAMNLTAGIFGEMMPNPILGIAVATFVVIFGHFLNFSLSLLGAFIHSGRLQFIEFFGKFYEGGGTKFQPFVRQPKYLFLEDK